MGHDTASKMVGEGWVAWAVGGSDEGARAKGGGGERKRRRCLGCGRLFVSAWAGNRFCGLCDASKELERAVPRRGSVNLSLLRRDRPKKDEDW